MNKCIITERAKKGAYKHNPELPATLCRGECNNCPFLIETKEKPFFHPISEASYQAMWKLKEKAKSWDYNDSLYWSEG